MTPYEAEINQKYAQLLLQQAECGRSHLTDVGRCGKCSDLLAQALKLRPQVTKFPNGIQSDRPPGKKLYEG